MGQRRARARRRRRGARSPLGRRPRRQRRSPSVAAMVAVGVRARRAATVALPSRTSSQAPPGSAPTSTSRIVSPLRKPSRRTALPLRRQPSSARHGDCAHRPRVAAARGRRARLRRARRAARRRRAAALAGGNSRSPARARSARCRGRRWRTTASRPAAPRNSTLLATPTIRYARQRRRCMRASAPARSVAVDDQLGDHRVVVRRDRVALLDAGVDAHVTRSPAAARGGRSVRSTAGSRGPDPRRRCAPRSRGPSIAELALRQRQRLAGRDAQLPLDQVEPGDHLGDRMLDLQARVHLHEVEAAVRMGDELDRAGADVADRLAPPRPRRGPSPRGARRVMPGRGRLLEHLLVAALHRAVALEQVDAVADACRRRPGSRCGAASVTYCSTSTRSSPNALLRLALARRRAPPRSRRPRRPAACPCRRRRRSP